MEKPAVNFKQLLFAALVAGTIALTLGLRDYADKRTRLIFCDVGQGDAAYIRISGRSDVLIDAGPDRKVLDCLGRHMPFFDRQIETVFISHPDKDHYGGLEYVVARYHVGNIILPARTILPASLKQMLHNAAVKGTHISYSTNNQELRISNASFIILNSLFPVADIQSSDNAESLVVLFRQTGRSILFTGDSEPGIIIRFLIRWRQSYGEKISILKVPHHGSQQAISRQMLRLAEPTIGVISCALHNSYGHPAEKTINLLKAQKIKILRTDLQGDIVFKW